MKLQSVPMLISWTSLGLVVVGVSFFLYITINTPEKESEYQDSYLSSEETISLDFFVDGKVVPKDTKARLPFAVVIDNHTSARSQYGLFDARLVYEMLVEGGVTRFLAFYQNNDVDMIGPVRSAREYFLPLVIENGVAFVHSGGSPKSLRRIEELGVYDIEEISYLGEEYFWRDENISGPHNLFTSSDSLETMRALLEYPGKPSFRPWVFERGDVLGEKITRDERLALLYAPEELEDATGSNDDSGDTKRVVVNWSEGSLYDVAYEYNDSSGMYERWLAGSPHRDALNNRQILVKTVVVQMVPREVELDGVGRLDIDLVGEGQAVVFYEGDTYPAIWKKESLESRTIFYDLSGDEMVFVPGNIWVHVVPGDREITYE